MAKTRRARRGKAKPLRILIVEGRFYDGISDALLAGARAVLEEEGCEYTSITVPGALEVPAAIAMAVEAADYDGVVALGCVIRGETYHFEAVANESARGLMELSLRGLAIGNGILTVENETQAKARAGGAEGNKGAQAARAALVLARLKRDLA
ncbi:MAG TPA: 6,7-dimethyl-8-ribityllumazine synthase [Pseudolabrys sp.]|nr:6,7-dimethyl-8-ribityllumazine synthase [Pseudolabrys sp.]